MQPVCWVASLLAMMSLTGNGLFLLVVLREKAFRLASTHALMALAITDVGFGIALVFEIECFYNIIESPWKTRLTFYIRSGSSAFILLVVAIERYLAVMKPFYHKVHVTTKWIWKLLFLAFIILSIVIPPYWVITCVPWSNSAKNTSQANTSEVDEGNSTFYWDLIFGYEVLVICFISILPALLMSILYGRIIYRVWFKQTTEGTNAGIMRARRKMTKLLLTVTIVFYLCMLPLAVNMSSQVSDEVKMWMIVFPLLNTVLNPLIYSLHSAPFRRGIKSLFKCCLPEDLWDDSGRHGRRTAGGTINLSFSSHKTHSLNRENAATKNQVVCLSVIDTNNE